MLGQCFARGEATQDWPPFRVFYFFPFNTLLHIHAAPHIHTSKPPGKTRHSLTRNCLVGGLSASGTPQFFSGGLSASQTPL